MHPEGDLSAQPSEVAEKNLGELVALRGKKPSDDIHYAHSRSVARGVDAVGIGTLFWLAGLALIWMEFYLPGGVLGACAVFLLIAAPFAWTIAGATATQLLWGIAAITLSVIALSIFALKTLKRGAAIEAKSEEGHCAATFRVDLIGRAARAVGDLTPSGYVEIDHMRFAAISQEGHIASGAKVIIRGGEGFSLLVALKPNSP